MLAQRMVRGESSWDCVSNHTIPTSLRLGSPRVGYELESMTLGSRSPVARGIWLRVPKQVTLLSYAVATINFSFFTPCVNSGPHPAANGGGMRDWGRIFRLRLLTGNLIHQPDELVGVSVPDLVQSN